MNKHEECAQCGTTKFSTNRPGLNQLVYRMGTHSSFFDTMKAALSKRQFASLRGLTTRDNDDPAIAFLDAWATVADVLTFYQERIANEGYLRTAIERRSIVELARLVDYQPRPGVAASTYLAYTLEKDSEVTIPAGSRAQSIPGPGELPQSFETAEALVARAKWNNLKARQTRPQVLRPDPPDPQGQKSPPSQKVLYLEGITTNLKLNDPILIVYTENQKEFRYVQRVSVEAEKNRTKIVLQPPKNPSATPSPPIGEHESHSALSPIARLAALIKPLTKAPAGHPRNAAHLKRNVPEAFSAKSDTMPALLMALHPHVASQLYQALETTRASEDSNVKVYAPRVAASVFGHNAPLRPVFNEHGAMIDSEEWPLGKTSTIRLTIPHTIPDGNAKAVITEDKETATGEFSPRAPFEASVSSNRRMVVKLTTSHPTAEFPFPTVTVAIVGYEDELEITIERGEARTQVTIGKSVHLVSLGQTVRFRAQERWVMLGFDGNSISITIETILSPSPAFLKELHLDALYSQITPDSWVAITSDDPLPIIRRVGSVRNKSVTAYGLSGKVTQLASDESWFRSTPRLLSDIRDLSVYAHSEELKLAGAPIEEPVCDRTIELDGLYGGLEPGRWLIVEGERTDIDYTSGVRAAELVMLAGVDLGVQKLKGDDIPAEKVHTFIHLAEPLAYVYKRDTVTIHGNVVQATHGETKAEVIGSGDAKKTAQQFTLRLRRLRERGAL